MFHVCKYNITMLLIYIIMVFCVFICCVCEDIVDSDIGLNAVQLVQKYGYPIETHYVTTEDGYILGIHRLPNGRKNKMSNKTNRRQSVLLVHGLLGSSENYLNMGPEKSLGFILADAGYDVWLSNARGTFWSKNHTNLNPQKNARQFWNFSWHEIGYYDNPAIIDHILKETGEDDLFYVGHSQGGTTLAVMLTDRPEYNAKIKLALLLAPSVFLENFQSGAIVDVVMANLEQVEIFFSRMHFYNVPFTDNLRSFLQRYCAESKNYEICSQILFSICGYPDKEQLNMTKLAVIFSNSPASASMKQMWHYAQIVKSKVFAHYDFGEQQNLIVYGIKEPPIYDLSKIIAPIAIYYGENDALVNKKDIEKLYKILSNVVKMYLVPFEKFNHGDFLMAIDVVDLVYNELLNDIEHYQKLRI